MLDVGGGDAEGAEEESEDAVLDVAADREAHDFGEGELDGVGVFESGEDAAAEGSIGVFALVDALPAVVEVAAALAAQGGGSALDAVDFDVLATEDWFGGGHYCCSLKTRDFRAAPEGAANATNLRHR